jgi:hypothetical protein
MSSTLETTSVGLFEHAKLERTDVLFEELPTFPEMPFSSLIPDP